MERFFTPMQQAITLLHKWHMGIGEKLPSRIGDFVQRVISRNSPEKMKVKV
jgi:hypothetical protein